MNRPLRIVTLLPSATEHVAALGFAEQIVGRSHECDYPSSVQSARPLTVPRVDSSLSSLDIDQSVRAALRDVLTVYELDVEGLKELQPDVIVTQDLCDVCAVSFDDVCAAAAELGLESEIVRLHPTRLGDIREDLFKVARALSAIESAERVSQEMTRRYDAIRALVSGRTHTPRTLTIEWIEPVMVGGTWMPELVEMCGGSCLVTSPGDHAPTLDREALAALNPEVVLIKPCGFELERTEREMGTIKDLLGAMPWDAVSSGQVYVADGNAYFNRSGPRIVDSAEILAACIHPELCQEYAEQHRDAYYQLA